MKARVLILTMGLIGFISAGSKAAPSEGLLAYYSFDSGDLAMDHSGFDRHGINLGAEPVAGIKGTAAHFDGNSSIIVDVFRNWPWGEAFTVSCWFKREGRLTSYASFINAGTGRTGSWGVKVGREQDGTSIWPGIVTADDPDALDFDGLFGDVNQWHHIAITYNGVSLYAFLDGKAYPSRREDGGQILQTDNPLRLGITFRPDQEPEPFVGSVDEVRLYNRALSPAEVIGHFNEIVTGTTLGKQAVPGQVAAPAATTPIPTVPPVPARPTHTPVPPTPMPAPNPAVPPPVTDVEPVLPVIEGKSRQPPPPIAPRVIPSAGGASAPPAPPVSSPAGVSGETRVKGINRDCCEVLKDWQELWSQGSEGKQQVIDELNLIAPSASGN